MLGLGGGPDGCLGGLPTSTPTSSPHRGMYKEGDRGHLRLPSHTLATAGQSGNFLLLDSGSTEPLGVEENTCLHFHGLDVGLLLFFACGEGRTKGTVAELREWLRGPTVGLSPLPGARGSANHLVVPVSNSMARQVPGTMLAPRTQGTARAEKGLGGGGGPHLDDGKAGAVVLAHALSQEHGRGRLQIAPLTSSQSTELPSQRRGQTAQPPLALEWSICFREWALGVGRGAGRLQQDSGKATSRLWDGFLLWKMKMLAMISKVLLQISIWWFCD